MADQELSLLNKVELKIALAETDHQLEQSLNTFLSPILLKLASPHAEVRNSVLKIIQHIIPRITAARNLKLPIESLIEQINYPNVKTGLDPTSVRLYSALFLSRGIDRINEEERKTYVPSIVKEISNLPPLIAARMFSILYKILGTWKAPGYKSDEYNQLRTNLNLEQNERYLSLKISQFFLLTLESLNTPSSGLAASDIKFFTTDAGVTFKTSIELSRYKLSLFSFIQSGFSDEQLVLPLLIASADPSLSLNEAEKLFKKLEVKYENVQLYGGIPLIDLLINIYLKCGNSAFDLNLKYKIIQTLLKIKSIRNHEKLTDIVSIALESPSTKLRKLGTDLIGSVTTDNIENLKEFTENIANKLRSSLSQDKSENYNSLVIAELQSKYETLGNLLLASPQIFINDWSYINFLLQALENENVEVKVSIQNVLSSLTVHFNKLNDSNKQELISSAWDAVNANSMTKYIITKYINLAFPFDDSTARMLTIIGTNINNPPEIIEESNKGLHPYWFKLLQANNSTESIFAANTESVKFPSFQDFVEKLVNEIANPNSPIQQVLPKALEFAEQILVMEALEGKKTVVETDKNWSIRLEKAIEMNEEVRKLVIEKLKNDKTIEPQVVDLLRICIDGLVGQHTKSNSLNPFYARTLAKLLPFTSDEIVQQLLPKLDEIINIVNSVDRNNLSDVCKIIGILASHPLVDSNSVLSKTGENESQTILQCYVMSRVFARNVNTGSITSDSLTNLLKQLVQISNNRYPIASDGISQLAMYGVLNKFKNPEINTLLDQLKTNARTKIKKFDEKAVIELGYLTLVDERSNEENLTEDEKSIYEFHNSKEIESIFASAEAFVITSAGWKSKLLQKKLDIPTVNIENLPNSTIRLPFILDLVISACKDTKPSLRKAGCIWALAMVQNCGHLQQVKDRATDLHISFMRFLADKDELIQDSASRGLALVYEMGDVELKEYLVKSLLKSFTQSDTNSITSGSIEENTQLFEPDLLKTNDGSVSTYKDVLNLAQDAGDPSLVYKFMSLAKSSTLWSSRKGIAYGLESILSQSSLDQLLSTNSNFANRLIPKLFRYRYDPFTSVSQSMDSIWNSIVKDSSKTINDNFTSILNELLSGMGKKEWRVRQASAAALIDLLQSVELSKYEYRIEEIWSMSFRIMDDIKESVRKEGLRLTKSLTTTMTNTLKKSNKNTNENLLGKLIEFLLGNKGILSDSQDIKDFSIDTLLKLCKTKTKALKPYISILIENFIGLFSSLEPEVVNYLALNAGKYNIDNNEFDSKRLQSVGKSPLMDAIEFLLSQLDDESIPQFITKLEHSIKYSVGLPSKVSGSKVLISLVIDHNQQMKPYSSKLLDIASSQIKNRNDTVASCYAAAAGYICRIANVDSIIKYSEKITKLYFEPKEPGDERSRILSSIASECVSKYSGDKFSIVASAFLPLAYIGKFDSVKSVSHNFDKEWTEHTSGDSAIKLYSTEILELLEKYIKSNDFAVKITLAIALSHLCKVSNQESVLFQQFIGKTVDLLIEANKGKSWEGKEYIFGALVDFAILVQKNSEINDSLLQSVEKTVITEIKRKNKRYQRLAIQQCSKFIHSIHNNEELIDEYIRIMGEILNREFEMKDDDSDEEMVHPIPTSYNEENVLKIISNLTESFYNPINFKLFKFIMETYREVFDSSIYVTWRSRIEITKLMRKISGLITDVSNEVANELMKTWDLLKSECLTLDSLESVKIEFIRLSKELILHLNDENKAIVQSQLNEYLKSETSNVVKVEIEK
ncbi:ECM29 [Candida pseudojiufengensis]|uniref:ECM29 n=1 Tax=Candida pseudojiufengensis TaxID=497109 RepID=UPI002224AF92|nr:ECM29 [Candida pseudojiufengensis]KAI5961626.1 ECM29 [Candida pseudojiufengensis]